ncbi:MAG: glutathione S-transferase family protein [Porticoccus sp.]|nr:glutathione S-transferase family protein [Porticoccus sp.]
MKLYTYPPAPNPMRLDIFLAEKGIDIETEHVDLMAREQFNESFRTVNSWGTVPALVLDDGEVLTEVVGMYSYLEDIYPQTPLLGTDPLSRALILSWDHHCFTDGFQAVAEVLRNSAPGFAGRALPGPVSYEQIPELADRGNERIQAFYRVLNEHLEGREFMVGDNFTIADISAYVFVKFSGWVKATIPDECVHLSAWCQQISTRDSVPS